MKYLQKVIYDQIQNLQTGNNFSKIEVSNKKNKMLLMCYLSAAFHHFYFVFFFSVNRNDYVSINFNNVLLKQLLFLCTNLIYKNVEGFRLQKTEVR